MEHGRPQKGSAKMLRVYEIRCLAARNSFEIPALDIVSLIIQWRSGRETDLSNAPTGIRMGRHNAGEQGMPFSQRTPKERPDSLSPGNQHLMCHNPCLQRMWAAPRGRGLYFPAQQIPISTSRRLETVPCELQLHRSVSGMVLRSRIVVVSRP